MAARGRGQAAAHRIQFGIIAQRIPSVHALRQKIPVSLARIRQGVKQVLNVPPNKKQGILLARPKNGVHSPLRGSAKYPLRGAPGQSARPSLRGSARPPLRGSAPSSLRGSARYSLRGAPAIPSARRSAALQEARFSRRSAPSRSRRSPEKAPKISRPARPRPPEGPRPNHPKLKSRRFTNASSYLEPGQAFTSGKDWHLRSSKSGNRV